MYAAYTIIPGAAPHEKGAIVKTFPSWREGHAWMQENHEGHELLEVDEEITEEAQETCNLADQYVELGWSTLSADQPDSEDDEYDHRDNEEEDWHDYSYNRSVYYGTW